MVRQIVILGAGYGGLRAALELDRLTFGLRDLAITLVDRSPFHELVVELPEVAVGRLLASRVRLPLTRMLAGRRVRLQVGTVRGFDLARRVVSSDTGDVAYDMLIIALGSATDYFSIPGLEEHALPLRWVDDAVRLRDQLRQFRVRIRQAATPAEQQRLAQIVIGGGGFTGVELAGELADWLRHEHAMGHIPPHAGAVTVVEADHRLLPGFPTSLSKEAMELLTRKGVRFQLGAPIVSVDPTGAQLADGRRMPAALLAWTGGVQAAPIIGLSGLAHGAHGRLLTDPYLRAEGRRDIYVIGDAALANEPETGKRMPPSAQLAIGQARVAAANVAATLEHRPLRPARLALFGEVISLGQWDAVATIGGLDFHGIKAALAKRAAALNYLRGLGSTALIDRAGLFEAPPSLPTSDLTSPSRPAPSPERAGGTTWTSAI